MLQGYSNCKKKKKKNAQCKSCLKNMLKLNFGQKMDKNTPKI